ncbi:MAG: multidrug effflux MFS transporter [Alphaproteobacteria bacterium]|jgi:MFS transporter, DHA1 family, multidrug resistance protein|nr:multidrug effflux MFS transporter [Alphaproteobacteria bacterium]MBT4711104.1 multidrug effflux MFS transporter [Alphaproteobacteria bacterium]
MKLSDGQIVAFVTILVAVAQISISIYLPSMPALVEVFATEPSVVQLTVTVYMLGAAVSQLIVGALSDRFGRRPVLMVGLAIFFVASAAAMLAPTIEALIVARFFQSIGAMAGPVIGRAIVRDRFDRARAAQVMAYVGLALAISPALAPVLGAFVQQTVGWRANFGLLMGFGAFIAYMAWAHLEETNTQKQVGAGVRELAGNYWVLLKSPAFLSYGLATGFVFGAMFAFLAEGPFLFVNLMGYTPTQYAWFSAVTVGGFAAGTFVTSKMTLKLGIDPMIKMGMVPVLGAGALIVGLAYGAPLSAWAIIGPLTLMMFGMGLVVPNGLAGAISVHPEMAGTGSALIGFLQMGLAGVATYLVPRVSDGTQVPMTLVIAAFAAAAAGSYLLRRLEPPVGQTP